MALHSSLGSEPLILVMIGISLKAQREGILVPLPIFHTHSNRLLYYLLTLNLGLWVASLTSQAITTELRSHWETIGCQTLHGALIVVLRMCMLDIDSALEFGVMSGRSVGKKTSRLLRQDVLL